MSEERKKSVQEILAEFRDEFTVHDCDDCEMDKSCESGVFNSEECRERRESWKLAFGIKDMTFSGLLDRLEEAVGLEGRTEAPRQNGDDQGAAGNAAALREALTLDEAINHAREVGNRLDNSCGKEHNQLADWLCELRERRKVGNAAKLRDALSSLLAWCEAHTGACAIRVAPVPDDEVVVWDERDRAMERARSALAAPPRNCDRFATAADAVAAHKQVEQNCPPEDCPECPYIVGRKSGVYCFSAWLFAPAAQDGGEP